MTAAHPVISVVMPAHNEEGYLVAAVDEVLSGLRAGGEPFEIIVVENGSADGTGAVAAALADRHPEVASVRLAGADYGLALRAGFLAASGDLVVNFDVDFVDLGFVAAARRIVEERDAAIVVGTKRGAGADDRRSPGRRAVTAIFSLVLRFGFDLHVSDTHGLKLLRRERVAPLVEACGFGGDIFDTELVLRTDRAGLVVAEVPVRVIDHRPPRTSILRRIPRSLLGLLRLRLALWAPRS